MLAVQRLSVTNAALRIELPDLAQNAALVAVYQAEMLLWLGWNYLVQKCSGGYRVRPNAKVTNTLETKVSQ